MYNWFAKLWLCKPVKLQILLDNAAYGELNNAGSGYPYTRVGVLRVGCGGYGYYAGSS